MFVWADEGSELTVDVPVTFKGEDLCPGLKKGNVLFWFHCFDTMMISSWSVSTCKVVSEEVGSMSDV